MHSPYNKIPGYIRNAASIAQHAKFAQAAELPRLTKRQTGDQLSSLALRRAQEAYDKQLAACFSLEEMD